MKGTHEKAAQHGADAQEIRLPDSPQSVGVNRKENQAEAQSGQEQSHSQMLALDPQVVADVKAGRRQFRVLNLGAGVQSSAVFAMVCLGKLPPIDVAIFADVGWEPREVYDHLQRLEALSKRHGVPVVRTVYGNLRDDMLTSWRFNKPTPDGRSFGSVPLFVKGKKGNGMLRRQCTSKYKIRPVDRAIKQLLQVKTYAELPARSVRKLFGISGDELTRMRSADVKATAHEYPLVFRPGVDYDSWAEHDDPDMWLTPTVQRAACLQWWRDNMPDMPLPPRSACVGCPYHTDAEWLRIKADPDAWADAVEFDKQIRTCTHLEGQSFLHAQRVPLDQVKLKPQPDNDETQREIFGECEGMCGV